MPWNRKYFATRVALFCPPLASADTQTSSAVCLQTRPCHGARSQIPQLIPEAVSLPATVASFLRVVRDRIQITVQAQLQTSEVGAILVLIV